MAPGYMGQVMQGAMQVQSDSRGREGHPGKGRIIVAVIYAAAGLACVCLFFLTAAISFRRPGELASLFSSSHTWRFFIVPLVVLFFVALGCLLLVLAEILSPRYAARDESTGGRVLRYLCITALLAIIVCSAIYVSALHLKTKTMRYGNIVIINVDPYEDEIAPYFGSYAFAMLLALPAFAVLCIMSVTRSFRGTEPG